jgi:hypothetical protein
VLPIIQVNTLFPSPTDDEGRTKVSKLRNSDIEFPKGGVILIKLRRKLDVSPTISIATTYINRKGQLDSALTNTIFPTEFLNGIYLTITDALPIKVMPHIIQMRV